MFDASKRIDTDETQLPFIQTAEVRAIDSAFEKYCLERMLRQGRLILGAVGGLDLLWWPLDWVVFAPTLPEHMPALIRVRSVLTILTGSFLLVSFIRRLQPHIFWAFAVTACACSFASAAAAASVGGPDIPNFHTLYICVLATFPLPLVLRKRIFLTAALALSTGLGLFLLTPQHLQSKYAALAISFLVCTFVVSTAFGHSQFALLRDNFYQSAQLGAYGRELESRVAARTVELRKLLDHVETAREAERQNISRELHDELGQELLALRYSLGLAKMRYQSDPLSIAANLEDLEALLRRTTQTTRSLVTDLRPRSIDDLGLGAAVDWLVERTKQRSGLDCRLSMDGEIDSLDEKIAMAAFRLVQEALTNVTKHAEASEVCIDIHADQAALTIEVRDDGIGLRARRERGNSEQSSGVGLMGMRERVGTLGGELWIGEEPGHKGTVVRCRVPRVRKSISQGERIEVRA